MWDQIINNYEKIFIFDGAFVTLLHKAALTQLYAEEIFTVS